MRKGKYAEWIGELFEENVLLPIEMCCMISSVIVLIANDICYLCLNSNYEHYKKKSIIVKHHHNLLAPALNETWGSDHQTLLNCGWLVPKQRVSLLRLDPDRDSTFSKD